MREVIRGSVLTHDEVCIVKDGGTSGDNETWPPALQHCLGLASLSHSRLPVLMEVRHPATSRLTETRLPNKGRSSIFSGTGDCREGWQGADGEQGVWVGPGVRAWVRPGRAGRDLRRGKARACTQASDTPGLSGAAVLVPGWGGWGGAPGRGRQ